MRQFCLILTCALWATAAPAQEGEPFSGEGYLLACGEEGCFVGARGYTLFVPADGAPPPARWPGSRRFLRCGSAGICRISGMPMLIWR
ncbi:hypothetical protein ACFSHQ_18890 [Gemmobacter lanyuensis]